MPALCPSRASTLHDTTARSNNDANRGRDRTQIDSIGRWDSTAYRQSVVGSPEVESLVSDQLSHFLPRGRVVGRIAECPLAVRAYAAGRRQSGFRRSRSTAQ